MPQFIATLRYFPVGLVAGAPEPIVKSDIYKLAQKYGVSIELEEVTGKDAEIKGDVINEETMNHAIEEITQSAITVSSDDETAFKNAVQELIKKFSAPRTVYGTLGSNNAGKAVISRLCDVYDGWY
jgi:hypothetical protein